MYRFPPAGHKKGVSYIGECSKSLQREKAFINCVLLHAISHDWLMIKAGNRRTRRNAGRYIAAAWPFLLFLTVFLSTLIAARHSDMVEKIYSGGIYPVISQALSFFSRKIPFSLWDIFWVLILIMVMGGIVLLLFRKIRFLWFGRRIICMLSILYAFFYLSWGYNYFRPDIAKRLSWENTSNDEFRFRSILDSLIFQAKRYHTVIKASEYHEFDSLVEQSYSKNSHFLKINYPNGTRRPKSMTFSSIFHQIRCKRIFWTFF